MLFAYFAPEVILPVASIVTGAIGFVVMIGRAPFRLAARGMRSGLSNLRNRFKP